VDPDVIVVGAGIVGLSCAWGLAQRGRQVLVVERGEVTGASRAAAMIAPVGYLEDPRASLTADLIAAALHREVPAAPAAGAVRPGPLRPRRAPLHRAGARPVTTRPVPPRGGGIGHDTDMATHPARPDGWLIPAALAFLAAAVVFATVMLVWHGGAGTGAPAGAAGTAPPAGAPASGVPSPAAPGTTPGSPAATGVGGGPGTVRTVKTGLCLDVDNRQDAEGAAAVQADCTGADSQRWRQVAAPGGAVTLVNAASGKCLDVFGGSTDDKAKVEQWSCNGGANQQWQVTAAAGGVTLVAVGSGKCLDVPGRSRKAGTRLQQYHCNGSSAQQWALA
jgi:hypothetical protein